MFQIVYFLIKWIFPGHESDAAGAACWCFSGMMWSNLNRYDEVKDDFGWMWLFVHWALMIGAVLYGFKMMVSG